MTEQLKRGDCLRWKPAPHLFIYVTRVAKDGSWADIFTRDSHSEASWTKRQPCPLDDNFEVLP